MKPIAPSVWANEHTLSLPGGVELPVRSSIVRLSDGSLWVHSPTPLSDELASQIGALGPVAQIVVPSRMHHLWAGEWSARFTRTCVVAAPGVADKRPDLRIDRVLQPESCGSEIEHLLVQGAPKLNEVVFFHRASRTLFVSDLVFNVREPRGWATSLTLSVMGTRGRLAKSRAWKLYVRDARAHQASLTRILDWDFDRLVMAHGEVVESGARELLGAALSVKAAA